ncbi:8-oxo-dGTP diphosphatase [Psychromicrobium silvestre]|uniref:Oxidized purine nucleoside triphosphate hydrolase n=1 Tax=Psychromicrobium silvestre TaxID=1645614 RepID=A0A7Y9S3I4_9MICC|nr:8-oxo-dGTP diphosphatase [Psychromicrobium silvestre]NYE93844.1 8-oxo-dGTP diphosphatase [Psychromicrobium silvestre]
MTAAPVTLVFLLREDQVLLGLKKTGFGQGKIVGIGGHVEPGESTTAAAVREVFEETSVRVEEAELVFRGTVKFRFPARPDWDMDTSVFSATRWLGTPVETEEIAPQWHPLEELPLNSMWQDAEHWLPALLKGPERHFTVLMAADSEGVEAVSAE